MDGLDSHLIVHAAKCSRNMPLPLFFRGLATFVVLYKDLEEFFWGLSGSAKSAWIAWSPRNLAGRCGEECTERYRYLSNTGCLSSTNTLKQHAKEGTVWKKLRISAHRNTKCNTSSISCLRCMSFSECGRCNVHLK